MQGNKRKGFTIVELVIVIAVIAILAVVLVPMFTGLFQKAYVTADTQIVRSLNAELSREEAVSGKPGDFNGVIGALREADYGSVDWKPAAEGYYFVWEAQSNQILLVDGENEYEVACKSRELTNTEIGASWHFVVNDREQAARLRAKGATVVIGMSQATFEQDFDELFAAGGTGTAILLEDVTLSGEDKGSFILEGGADAGITCNLNQNTLTADYFAEGSHLFKIREGELNLSNGTIVVNGKEDAAPGIYGAVSVQSVTDGMTPVANIEHMVFQTDVAYGSCVRAAQDGTVNIRDSVITANGSGGLYACGNGVMNVENVKISQTGYFDHNSNAVVAAEGAVVNIKSGEFTTENHCVFVFDSGGTVNISGGTFVKTAADAMFWAAGGEIVVTGGTFVLNGETMKFADMGQEDWEKLINTNLCKVVIEDHVVTITAK